MTVRTGAKIFPFFHLQAGRNWLNAIEKKQTPCLSSGPLGRPDHPSGSPPPPPLFLDNVLGVLMDQIPKKYFVSTAGILSYKK